MFKVFAMTGRLAVVTKVSSWYNNALLPLLLLLLMCMHCMASCEGLLL